MAQALLSPQKTLPLLNSEILPKSQFVLKILSDISTIPLTPNQPQAQTALRHCILNLISPFFALLSFGSNLPAPILPNNKTLDTEALAQHFYHYAIGGLKAAGEAWWRWPCAMLRRFRI